MPRRKKSKKEEKTADGNGRAGSRPISLRQLAAHLDLSPTTLSLVLNESPQARSIPPETRARIFALPAAPIRLTPNC